MGFLYALQSIRNPVLDAFFATVTHLGEETVFLVAALFVFWCVNKKWGYYLLSIGFIGTIFNQFLKLVFRIPRPWVLDPDFDIVESARAEATGYSFPSGHTQNAVGTIGGIAHFTRVNWLRVLCWILIVLVPLSRMYLGVHTPKDVLVSFVIAIALVYGLRPLMERSEREPRVLYVMLFAMALLAIAYVLYVELWNFPENIDPANYASGRGNGYKLLGAVLGVNIVHYLDDQFFRFSTKATPVGQALKFVLGLLAVLAVKVFAKAPLIAIFAGHPAADAIRYFLLVFVAGVLWPMTFRWFEDLKRKNR